MKKCPKNFYQQGYGGVCHVGFGGADFAPQILYGRQTARIRIIGFLTRLKYLQKRDRKMQNLVNNEDVFFRKLI